MNTKLEIPRVIKLYAAFFLPSCVRNSLERALPMTVPPFKASNMKYQKNFTGNAQVRWQCSTLLMIPDTACHVSSLIKSPPLNMPS